MRTLLPSWRLVLALCALLPLANGLLRGAEEPTPRAGSVSPSAQDKGTTLDKQISETVRTIINIGADLYNREGDRAGCYRLYQGAAMALRPMLGSHPDLQAAIDSALAESERTPSVARRAFALNTVLQEVHKKLKPAVAADDKGPERKLLPSAGLKPSGTETLWDRLGGEAAVRRVVDDFVAIVATDPKVNFSRNGKFKFTDKQVAELKNKLVAFVSQATGGSLKYSGKSMKEAHAGMGISNAEFDAAVVDLRKALEGQAVKPAEAQDVLALVETTRKDIVEVKKPEEKKPGSTPPGDSKGADKSKG
jgi:hemoglobin